MTITLQKRARSMTCAALIRLLLGAAALPVSLSACATLLEELNRPLRAHSDGPFERSKSFLSQGNYDAAYRENQKVLADGKGAPDQALYNMGLISAHSSNPQKDYPRALRSFRTLVSKHPQSQFAEQSKIWIQVLEEHQKISDEKQQLVEDKRSLAREKEQLAQEQKKLKYTLEKTRQVDLEIERQRRRSLKR